MLCQPERRCRTPVICTTRHKPSVCHGVAVPAASAGQAADAPVCCCSLTAEVVILGLLCFIVYSLPFPTDSSCIVIFHGHTHALHPCRW